VKVVLRLILLALAVGGIAFGLTRLLAHPHAKTDEMAWMKTEFHLTPAQTAAIEKIHEAYAPVCMEHCRRIRDTRALLQSIETAGRLNTAEHAAALAEMIRLKGICHDATQKQLEDVAAQMAPAEGRRFLALTLPKLSDQSHDGPIDLR
jgi:hypothetical protein